MDIIIDGNIQPSDGFMIGATTSQILDLTLLNKGDMVYGTSTIKVEIGLKIGNTIEYIPMGIYNIDDIEKTDYTIKITAFDNMMKFERNFTTTLGDTLTLQQVASELTRITGVQFTGNLPAYTVKKLEGFSCREILGYVASLCGGNAIITRDGKFTIVIPKDNSYSIGTSNYFEYKREETKYKIGKISCQVGEEVLIKGSLGADSMELQFENPWINTTILNDIYTKLNGFEYLGYSMKWQGDISLDVGDIITITDKKGVVRKHPILSQKFTYTGGLTSEISAKGENKNKNEFSGSGPSAKKVERVVMELALINKALIDVAYIGDLTAGNIKFDTASGTIMDLQTLLAKFVTGENGQFLNLTTDNVTISNALIKDVIAKSISVEDLKVGNIDSNRFNIVGTDGNLLIKDNTIQIKDSARVRVQIGKDASGDYSMYVWDKQGNLMFDALGLKSSAIKDKIIRDDMVADNANINGSKLNISSLITEVNKDNTQTLKASRISFDSTGQSLEVSFNSLKSNVDNMEIGGRNLQSNADFNKPLSGTWRYATQNMSISEDVLCDGYKSVKILRTNATTTGSTIYLYSGADKIPAKHGEEFTMSFMYYIPEDVTQEIDGSFYAGVYFYKDKGAGAGSKRIDLAKEIVKGKWTKVIVTGKATDIDTKSVAFVVGCNKNCEVYISKPKLERGNKATDFTVAPEETDEKIEANTTAISIAQGKIEGLIKESSITKGDVTTLKDNYTSIAATVDGINTTVSSHTSNIGSLNTNVSTIQSSITQLNNQIALKVEQTDIDTAVSAVDKKITATNAKVSSIDVNLNGITQRVTSTEGDITSLTNRMTTVEQDLSGYKITVNNTYLNKTDAVNIYATKSSMELTATQLKLDFSSSGGYNFVKNGNFQNGKAFWDKVGEPSIFAVGKYRPNGYGENVLALTTTASGQQASQLIEGLQVGRKYTVSCYIYIGRGSICMMEGNQWNGVYTKGTGWQWLSFSFVPNDSSVVIFIGSNDTAPIGSCHITAVSVTEGSERLAWTPHPNEIYSGNTTIDATGVKIYNGALTVLNNNGQVMLQGDSNGNLSFSGRLQPYDYQIRLFGNDCRIDGSAGAIRMQWNPQNYISVENGATRMYDNNSAGGTRYISFATDTEGHANIWGIQTRMKLLGNSSARPVIQSRNISDNAYGDFHGADFLNRSTIKDKTNVQEINDIDFKKLLMENTIKKYNLKTDVETVLDGFGLENTIDEVVASSADIRLGFILEELTQDARAMLSPGNMESISIYSMCSILWKVCQEQQKRIEALENLQ